MSRVGALEVVIEVYDNHPKSSEVRKRSVEKEMTSYGVLGTGKAAVLGQSRPSAENGYIAWGTGGERRRQSSLGKIWG